MSCPYTNTNVVSILSFAVRSRFGKPNVITFKAHYTRFVPENNLSLQDTKELNKTDVSTPKVKHIRSVNDSSISCEDNKKFMEVHVTAPRQSDAFLTENRPSLT